MTRVLAFDLSLTETGVARPDGTAGIITPGEDWALEDRHGELELEIAGELHHADWVAIEDLPRNVKYGGPALGVAHGAFCSAYNHHTKAIQLVRITPSSVKKYGTGKGNASKVMMVTAARERLGYDGYNDNEADALWLRAMVLEHLGAPLVKLPKTHTDALAKVEWP